MHSEKKDYEKIKKISKKAALLTSISELLDWDKETYMPSAGGEMRGEQLKLLAGMTHKQMTGKAFSKALSALIDIETGELKATSLPAPEKAALRLWRRDYLRDIALPGKFVEDFTVLTTKAMEVWAEARKNNNFALFAPYLAKIIAMSQKKADLLGYKEHPYDALLNLYEPDITKNEVAKLFSPLKNSIIQLLQTISSKRQLDNQFLSGNFSEEKQLAFGRMLLKDLGYDERRGRLDVSTHPFSCTLHPDDNRITTRIEPDFVMSNILAVLHEFGHGLYEMGLPAEQFGTPLGEAVSLGMHESQSRWWETRIGLSKPFWSRYLPHLQTYYPENFSRISIEQFYRGINKVTPSLIRVEADEVTYTLHIILRFELEVALIEGSLSVKDLPERWNSGMKELLGITPETDREGCLQDIHWAMGGFGYFPTYALGNMYASHFFENFEKNIPDWKNLVEKGDFGSIETWLKDKIHRYGRQYTGRELMEKNSGKSFSEEAYLSYLHKKYSDIYKE